MVNCHWQRQKEKLRKKIIRLEKQLDTKQALELEVERMRGALQVMKHMDEDMEIKKKMDEIEENLKEKIEELDGVEALNQALIVKERKTNDELQEARKELINVCTFFLLGFFYVRCEWLHNKLLWKNLYVYYRYALIIGTC